MSQTDSYKWVENRLNVDYLRYFLASIDLGSFQSAAEKLHVTPQAVGKAVAALEAQLGPLIVRDRRLRGLTPAGRALASEARSIIASLSDLAARVTLQPGRQPAGPVAVGGTSSICQHVLPSVFANLMRRYPKVQPQVLALPTPELERRLLSGELDLALLATPPETAGLEGHPGPDAPSVIVAVDQPPGPWDQFRYVVPCLADGKGIPIDGWPSRGYPRKIAAQTNQLEVAIRLVEAGVGASVVPLVTVLDRLRAGRLRVVAEPPVAIVHRLWVCSRAGSPLSPAAVALAEELESWQVQDQGFCQ